MMHVHIHTHMHIYSAVARIAIGISMVNLRTIKGLKGITGKIGTLWVMLLAEYEEYIMYVRRRQWNRGGWAVHAIRERRMHFRTLILEILRMHGRQVKCIKRCLRMYLEADIMRRE